jgi:hypothetical protein
MNEINKEVRGQAFGYISAALGLVACLAWNDAIKQMIDKFFPLAKDGLVVEFFYEIIVTVVVVILIQVLS